MKPKLPTFSLISYLIGLNADDWIVKQGRSSVILRSKKFPGQVVASDGKNTFTNLYVGYGFETTDKLFYPTAPPEVCADAADPEESQEPGPVEEGEAEE